MSFAACLDKTRNLRLGGARTVERSVRKGSPVVSPANVKATASTRVVSVY